MKFLGFLLITAFMSCFIMPAQACVHINDIYYWTDKRDAEHFKFDEALNCEGLSLRTLEMTIISLGRIGGESAVKKLYPLLSHPSMRIRKATAFALGIAKVPEAGVPLTTALAAEKEPEVQYRMALAIGNMGYQNAQEVLYRIIKQDSSVQKVRGALHGLVLFATFHKDDLDGVEALENKRMSELLKAPETQLEMSYLLARLSLINDENQPILLKLLPELAPEAQANLIRALAKTKSRKILPTLLSYLKSKHTGVRVNAIRGLGNYSENPVAIAGIIQALSYEDYISQVTALQTINPDWLQSPELLQKVKRNLAVEHSWVQSEALLALIRGDKADKSLAEQWLKARDPNYQRAAIAYFVKQKDRSTLEALAKSDKPVIANGAKQALKPETEKTEEPSPTDDALPKLPVMVKLETTKGDIMIKLFDDTPYTSLNFMELVQSGYYDNTYFHRVIPNFVAQGGSQFGDGSGNVDYSIREELSYRSHLTGTVGMATLGKDTGGAQFFINIAPNIAASKSLGAISP